MIVALSIAAAYLLLLGLVLRARTQRDPAEGWLLGFCGYSAALMGLHALIVSDAAVLPAPAQLIAVAGFVLSTILLGSLTLGYLGQTRQAQMIWGGIAAVWAIAVLGTHLMQAPAVMSNQTGPLGNLSSQINLSLEILVFGWALLSIGLFGVVAKAFVSEPLPLYANRILFWAAVLPIMLLGDALTTWQVDTWNYVGYVVRLLGTLLAAYGVLTHRVLDLRGTVRWLISRAILTLVTGSVVFGTIIGVLYLVGVHPVFNASWVIVGVIAIAAGIVLQLLWAFFRWMLRYMIDRDKTDAAEAVRLYSQRINTQINLSDLASIAAKTASELLGVRKSALILATLEDYDKIRLDLVGEAESARSGFISAASPIYRTFVETSRPILQYDIDYHKAYRDVVDSERHYFSRLEMDIYAPIVGEGRLIGMLALGPKANDDPYGPREMELLSALANQTVVALENARLVTDLRGLNVEITTLNQDLKNTNERLEKLDAVKSDFISIASHELRTPLTQMQGYADLLIEMSERNLLSPAQTIEIMTSLRRASQRMGEVISSMLDVSQIDVENMDLNFVETSLASIIKLAVDPYSEAIHERNLTLVARGLRDLPSIYGDYKRLVQAFEALVTNAIKFTPDGGKININGEIFEKDADGNPRSVRLSIEDTGIGIDAEHHELIFEKFYRVGSTTLHSTGTTKFKGAGPGLGLPIAKGIIDGHGGRVWVESDGANEETNPGTAFHVVLPVRPPAMQARERIAQLQELAEANEKEAAK